MKHTLFILSLSFLTLFSCSSGDNNSEDNATDILVGNWQYHKEGIFDTGSNIPSDVILEYYWDHECTTLKDFLIFGEDGEGLTAYYDENCIEHSTNFIWSKIGNTLLITINGEQENYKIVRLTKSELVIYSPPDSEGQPNFEVTGFIKQ